MVVVLRLSKPHSRTTYLGLNHGRRWHEGLESLISSQVLFDHTFFREQLRLMHDQTLSTAQAGLPSF